MANVLLASLGESPIVVTAMYDLLTKTEHYEIDKVVVLHPQGDMVRLGYDLIEEALKEKCELEAEMLPFDDANSEKNSYIFLKRLFQQISANQELGDTVYLSLAGGRKNMSALMAWVTPFFSCIKKLYHVLDADEHKSRHNFWSIEDLIEKLSETERRHAMHPDLERLILVDIPFGRAQQISDEIRLHLLAATEEELDVMEDEEAEAIEFVQEVARPGEMGRVLEVMVTAYVEEKFRKMCQDDVTHARAFQLCFERMRWASKLRNRSHDIFSWKFQEKEQLDTYSQKYKLRSLTFHFFKRGGSPERPVIHTVPKDIRNSSDDEVEAVIVSELEIEKEGSYRSLEEIVNSLTFPLEPSSSVTALPSVKSRVSHSILIVPLGVLPMVATQLYTLLTRKGKTIREVVLVYPERSREVLNSAELVKKAMSDEGGVRCSHVRIPGLKDIDSQEACEKYEKKLEETIDKVREENPDCQIELALSGGRKGMAALAMFVAQRKSIRYVYHTLINDDELSQQVEDETTVHALDGVNVDRKVRNDRLFLRAYEGEGPYTKFVLIKVPVLPAGGS